MLLTQGNSRGTLFKIKYLHACGQLMPITGSNLIDLSSRADGTIVAMYSWQEVVGGWKLIYECIEHVASQSKSHRKIANSVPMQQIEPMLA